MSRVNDLVEIAKDAAKDIIETKGEYHEPRLIMDCPLGLIHVIKFNRINESVKAHLQSKFKAILSEHKATAYIFVFEAWATEVIEHGKISDLPPDDRIEVLQIIVCEKGKKPWYVSAKIYNTPEGRKVGEYIEHRRLETTKDGLVLTELSGDLLITNW